MATWFLYITMANCEHALRSRVNTFSQSNCFDYAEVVDSPLHTSLVSHWVMETHFPKNNSRAHINIITGYALVLQWKKVI